MRRLCLGACLGKLDPPVRAVSTVKFNLLHFWLGTQVNQIWPSEASLRWVCIHTLTPGPAAWPAVVPPSASIYAESQGLGQQGGGAEKA